MARAAYQRHNFTLGRGHVSQRLIRRSGAAVTVMLPSVTCERVRKPVLSVRF